MRVVHVVLALAALSPGLEAQATLHVPASFPTIQSAINAASAGDTILVAPGTYFETLVGLGESVTLASTAGPESTIIDAQFGGRVVGAGFGCTIDGFTIRNGQAPHETRPAFPYPNGGGLNDGGGICVRGIVLFGPAPPTVIRNCIVIDNRAGDGGPAGVDQNGVYRAGDGGRGGGIAASPSIGAGMVRLERCVISGNRAGLAGDPSLATQGHGGGVSFDTRLLANGLAATLEIVNCLITGNETALTPTDPAKRGEGGGVHIERWNPLSSVTVHIDSSTITENHAAGPGAVAAIRSPTPPSVLVRNTIIAGNSLPQLGLLVATFDHCLVFPEVVSGPANLHVDPVFHDGVHGDFRLGAGSPCIDAGVVLPGTPATDLEGEPRILAYGIDIGSDEFCGLGTIDDFALETTINGAGDPAACIKQAQGGDLLTYTYLSPGGILDFASAFVGVQVFPNALPPLSLGPFPFVHLDPNQTVLVDGPIFLPPGGASVSAVFPPGLAGFTARMQGFVVSPFTGNGIFGGSNAHDFVLF